ncbi:MAG: 2-oxo acid dehydrogenase subunit E2 [Holosporaceae bacterium]|jgi:pyruvate/2-oxoglutarate dehydrogenase complex dihydrolipoamide acyltransferase (E2) component|nr:2-oxo acid dehydrogenase subunit E2 [Holosporaceae bacterium]
MRIDIIVPNFDESSDEVTLSSWYKKIGDKISKNEVIADAETPSIACGITSSYDCILAKILVKEGETIPPGSKIAIIETDLNADISDLRQRIMVEEVLEESREIETQILEDKMEQDLEIALDNRRYSLSVPLEEEIKENIRELSAVERVERKIVEDEIALEEKIADEVTERAEENFKSILRETEAKAKEEAQKLKEKILDEAVKQAQHQAEEMKAKILREYEEKAAKDAAEMHQKIIQGSLLEAENTKAQLIEEAKGKAHRESEKIREEILRKAEIEAKEKAKISLDEVLDQARRKAHREAELLSKEIIEETIRESKLEAKAIKKDIIHSAQKHAVKESENVVRNIISQAKKRSSVQAEEIVESATELATREAEIFREEILKSMRTEIKNTANLTLESIVKEVQRQMNHSIAEITLEVEADVGAHLDRIKRSTEKTLEKVECEIEQREEYIIKRAEKFGDKLMNQAEKAAERTLEKVENEIELCEEVVVEKAEKLERQLDVQSEIVRKLIRTDPNSSPEMYADNWNKPQYFASPDDSNEPIDPLRRRISEKMKDSYDASVISTVSNEVDMSAILSLEKTFGKAFSQKHNTRLGFTPFFVSACISALKQYRVFNAHIRGDEIIYKNNFDISIITCGNDGIAAPVIRHADSLSIAEIERIMISLSRRAIDGALSLEEVSGGTFTVVNAGIYGSLIGTDLLTPPQVATLSVHKMHNRPIATDSGVEIKPMLYISLSYDHRISDTKDASEFLANIKNYVENPGWQMLGL